LTGGSWPSVCSTFHPGRQEKHIPRSENQRPPLAILENNSQLSSNHEQEVCCGKTEPSTIDRFVLLGDPDDFETRTPEQCAHVARRPASNGESLSLENAIDLGWGWRFSHVTECSLELSQFLEPLRCPRSLGDWCLWGLSCKIAHSGLAPCLRSRPRWTEYIILRPPSGGGERIAGRRVLSSPSSNLGRRGMRSRGRHRRSVSVWAIIRKRDPILPFHVGIFRDHDPTISWHPIELYHGDARGTPTGPRAERWGTPREHVRRPGRNRRSRRHVL